MSVWRGVVDVLLPPPLILTVLLVLPTPRVVNQGLLTFAKNVLFLRVVAGVQLVHFVLVISGMMMIGAAVHTHQLRDGIDPGLSANQRTAVMARIWREERNFWISVLTFLMWGCLYRFYNLVLAFNGLRDRIGALEGELAGAQAQLKGGGGGGVPPKRAEAPSAPPAPSETEMTQRKDKEMAELRHRGAGAKAKAP
ncbi:hypothetical protein FOA52_012542 [Chlamydomonas sp. UWO 241]|nr:hypothetical protein FOA52_012542 [Chlamydomonas sp. UWO 241]